MPAAHDYVVCVPTNVGSFSREDLLLSAQIVFHVHWFHTVSIAFLNRCDILLASHIMESQRSLPHSELAEKNCAASLKKKNGSFMIHALSRSPALKWGL